MTRKMFLLMFIDEEKSNPIIQLEKKEITYPIKKYRGQK